MHSVRLQGRTNGHWNVADGELRSGSTKVAAAVVHGALILAVIAVLVLIAARPAQGQTETVLYNFCSQPNCSDGANPQSRLTSDGAGNFYGTTLKGGAYGAGTVFELSPNGSGGWTETVLHSFSGGADGANPLYSYVIFDSVGNLYGTASSGGAYGFGVVFELSPAGSSWTEMVLYSFCSPHTCAEGGSPMNGLVMDQAGNLFGTIYAGVFELSPSPGGWTQQWLYWTFPSTGLTMDPAGNLFFANLSQEVYELSPNGNGGWNPTALHTFTGYPKDGQNPQGTPVCDDGGNVYGTTTSGGRENGGTIYKLTPGKKGKWKERILHSFTYPGDGKDGSYPQAGIVLDAAGEMYGTTLWGKDSYPGTVYKLGKGGYKNLWTFNGTDGSGALGSLILDSAGNLYGTTSAGGANGSGVVFEVTP